MCKVYFDLITFIAVTYYFIVPSRERLDDALELWSARPRDFATYCIATLGCLSRRHCIDSNTRLFRAISCYAACIATVTMQNRGYVGDGKRPATALPQKIAAGERPNARALISMVFFVVQPLKKYLLRFRSRS